MKKKIVKNEKGMESLHSGILAFAFALVPVVGGVFGIRGWNSATEQESIERTTEAVVGHALSAIGFVTNVLATLIFLKLMWTLLTAAQYMYSY